MSKYIFGHGSDHRDGQNYQVKKHQIERRRKTFFFFCLKLDHNSWGIYSISHLIAFLFSRRYYPLCPLFALPQFNSIQGNALFFLINKNSWLYAIANLMWTVEMATHLFKITLGHHGMMKGFMQLDKMRECNRDKSDFQRQPLIIFLGPVSLHLLQKKTKTLNSIGHGILKVPLSTAASTIVNKKNI